MKSTTQLTKFDPFTKAEDSTSGLTEALSRILGRDISAVERITGGRNSKVFAVEDEASGRYIAKLYPEIGPGGRDRLVSEYNSLIFLSSHGEENVPHPIGLDTDYRLGVYEFIEGNAIGPSEATVEDVDRTVEFVGRLKKLAASEAADKLPLASEACFSIQGILDNLESRTQQLLLIDDQEKAYPELERFLHGEFVPFFEAIAGWCRDRLAASGANANTELDLHERTLSPSDIGLHNALKRPDGRIIFVDFEYFGWDDPAKMVADFLLHPAMDLSDMLKQRFACHVLEALGNTVALGERLNVVYPLVGLKWCLILLNEFLPEALERRSFANGKELNSSYIQAQQLAKSKQKLCQINREYQSTPFAI